MFGINRLQTNFVRVFGNMPNFDLNFDAEVAREFLRRGLKDFHAALNYVWRLPYGRNSNRADFNLVLCERRGTCSTKHALLAALAGEQKQSLFLTLGIYEMNAENTMGVGAVLDVYGLKKLPEAHCYLTYQTKRIDVTRLPKEGTTAVSQKMIENFLYEEQIEPEQIGSYKIVREL